MLFVPAFSFIQYINQQNALGNIQWNKNHKSHLVLCAKTCIFRNQGTIFGESSNNSVNT